MLVAKKRDEHLPFLMESMRGIRIPFAEKSSASACPIIL